jgi:transposase
MIVISAGVKVHLALGHTDMQKGLDGLATLIQEHLKKDPFTGHLFVFRGKNASLLKILFWDGTGLCLFTKRIDRGNFFWPRLAEPGSSVTLSPALARTGAHLATCSCRLKQRRNQHRI